MLIQKFGGTSVGSAQRIQALVSLIHKQEPCIVVLSAMSGTTNQLVTISNLLHQKNVSEALDLIEQLKSKYDQTIHELYHTAIHKEKAYEYIHAILSFIKSLTEDMFTIHEEKVVLAQGELMSTYLFHEYLNEQHIANTLLPALNFMRLNDKQEPDYIEITKQLTSELEKNEDHQLFITQGYICRNEFGEVDNLQRGGSDYTASIIGSVLKANEIQIWTDIDGMHNNDPRVVNKTHPIENLSFNEAAELAYFGAKILHPTCILPAQKEGIPVRLLNTMAPQLKGTLISDHTSGDGAKAVAAKDGITCITIKSTRMLLAYGFLRRIFDVFERYQTPVDMITTSEVAVSLSIDNDTHLAKIIKELEEFATVEIAKNKTILCIVGDFSAQTRGYAYLVFEALKNVAIQMISYGGSPHNISVLLSNDDKVYAMQQLNRVLFNYE
jgi:aspartate kinase